MSQVEVTTYHNDIITCEHGEVQLSYSFWTETFIVSQGQGYDYHLDYGITEETACEVMRDFGFDDSEIYDLRMCMKAMHKHQNKQEID